MTQYRYQYNKHKNSVPGVLSFVTIASALCIYVFHETHDYHDSDKYISILQQQQHPKRVAIVRPFSPVRAATIAHTFDSWNEYLPCQLGKQDLLSDSSDDTGIRMQYDLFLSYSQAYNGTDEAAREADQSTQYLMDNFHSFPWAKCFHNVYRIETNIPKEQDLYRPSQTDNALWVNGPNQQFLKGMHIIAHHHHHRSSSLSSSKHGLGIDPNGMPYDYAVVMESDVVPVKPNWLVDLIREANEHEFCMLGSKYAGIAWDGFRSSLPIALQHHLNGNAVYNLKHPLMKFLLKQLWEERETIYNAVPYDYRISQILVQGFLGEDPELPKDIMSKEDLALELHDGKDRMREFKKMWDSYGIVDGGAVMRESKVIRNLVGSPLLPRQLKTIEASLVHGAVVYTGWEEFRYNITLVVSEWHDEMAANLLAKIDESNHPFAAVELVVPRDLPRKTLHNLKSLETTIKLSIQERKKGVGDFDLCSANVQSDWFMITNSYHVVSDNVDLLFNKQGKFVIPAVPATDENCYTVSACKDSLDTAKDVFNVTEMYLVQDQNMVFHTKTLKEFCQIWSDAMTKERDEGKRMHMESMGILASAYVAFLHSKMSLRENYELSELDGFKHFKRIVSLGEELTASSGETVLANRLLKQRTRNNPTWLELFGDSHDVLGFEREMIIGAPTLTRSKQLSPPSSPGKAALTGRAKIITSQPSNSNTPSVSVKPSSQPSISSSPSISSFPTEIPSEIPSSVPSQSASPSILPSVSSAPSISAHPTAKDSVVPSMSTVPSLSSTPSSSPSVSSAPSISAHPTAKDSVGPSMSIVPSSSSAPSSSPSVSSAPSMSAHPTTKDSVRPSMSIVPSSSSAPSSSPSVSSAPSISVHPTAKDSVGPSMSTVPSSSSAPSSSPSVSSAPSLSAHPTAKDSVGPSMSIVPSSSSAPSSSPSVSSAPSISAHPTAKDSVVPSMSTVPSSSSAPSSNPSVSSAPSTSAQPSSVPSANPSFSFMPTGKSKNPSLSPSPTLTLIPSHNPTISQFPTNKLPTSPASPGKVVVIIEDDNDGTSVAVVPTTKGFFLTIPAILFLCI